MRVRRGSADGASDDTGPYGAWAAFLTEWAAGGQPSGTLPTLTVEDFRPDTWARLLDRVTEAVQLRLRRWADALVLALREAPDEFSTGRALTQGRTGLRAVRALTAHPGLPEEFRAGLAAMVDDVAGQVQTDLEHGVDLLARDDPQAAEARRRTVRDNPLTAVLDEEPVAPADDWAFDPSAPVRRRLFTD